MGAEISQCVGQRELLEVALHRATGDPDEFSRPGVRDDTSFTALVGSIGQPPVLNDEGALATVERLSVMRARFRGAGMVKCWNAGDHRSGGTAFTRSSMLPDMIVRTCSVMCWSGQSHQATASRRSMSASL